jgi:hypothetical protein
MGSCEWVPVAVDGSRGSMKAPRTTIAAAREPGASLNTFTAAEPPPRLAATTRAARC